jgi:glycosyltransferase involved in cell wall biosynthesis
MSLNILHVIQTVNPDSGGPIEGVCQQTRAHALFGHSVEIACLDKPESSYLSFPNAKVIPCDKSKLDRIVPITLYAFLKSNYSNYDCIVINGIWGPHLLIVWLALAKASTPYFVFCHGMLDPWFKNRFPLKHLKKWLVWPWAVYPALRDAEAVFFTCEQEKLLARRSFWLYDCAETVINYGTEGIPGPQDDYATTFLEAHPSLASKRIFLFLGRVHPKKGPDLLIRSIAILEQKGFWNPDTMKLVFAGPSDSAYASMLTELSEKLGVSSSLYWTGMIKGNLKWGAFQSAEVFVLPSHQENFGIAVVEALSCGVPVMISPSVNIATEIEQDGAGLVEPDNLTGTLQLFRRWLALSEAEKVSMGIAARQCFETRFHSSMTSTSITRAIYLAKFKRAVVGISTN